ncbi:efflux RND transporter periplasmic adaptor subunit [Niabella ginsengisoli]|uniref:Efflux RND transporter periplasmic adaptor subunit n=1 Tax=Niabella ginsengisoli TaxID=522298 RepID=A0ABS9SK14_9BACT|nr:efflux RND transporter periplasmic adaptor subunit [Niabella ginsengisoli]MCH5598682.1 efflux RND transporter periplasmic adaptor subunit [Niabella ginsengisoli]
MDDSTTFLQSAHSSNDCFQYYRMRIKKNEPGKKSAQQRVLPKLEGYIVGAEPFSELIEVPGSVVANEVTEIRPEVSGRLVQLNIAEGKTVNKGALLAKIYDGDLQAELKKLQSQLAIAQTNEGRASRLLEIQGISRNDYDLTLLNFNNIRADIDVVKTQIYRTEIRAPFTGKLGLRNISPGAYVSPADVIATINQVSELKLDFSIPEKYIGNIGVGQNVNFTVQGSDEVFAAKVYATESNVGLNNRSLLVRARVTGKNAGLVPGTFAKVKIGFQPNDNAIFVPSQSVVPTIKGKQVILYRSGTAVFQDVEIGGRDSARVEIITGLKVGDTILTTGIMTTVPDAKVQLGKITK